MKIQIFIDKNREEQVIVYAKERNELVEKIESLVKGADELIGFKEREMIPISQQEIYCFVAEENKIFAITENDSFQLKCRLYELEKQLPEDFIKINKSCIANLKKIKKFSAAFSGSLQVVFKNGRTDYVSRRNLKNVKERLGI